jgi:rhamnose transport system ATP-binding protein
MSPEASATSEPRIVLRASDIRKSFGGVHALSGVSLTLYAGEVHALVGENGAGKSTLIKILTGALEPDSGEFQLFGEVLTALSPAHARALGIAAVYQQPALFPHLTVAENIALARGGSSAWEKVDWRERRRQAAAALETVGARISPDAQAGKLSMPEQQLVEIAKAVGENPKVLILDEPTASLGESEAENLFRVLQQTRSRGTAIVYISHRFEELARLADRVTVLRDGLSVGTHFMSEITSEELVRLMIGRELKAIFPRIEQSAGDVVLSLRGIASAQSGVADVSLDLRRGEVLGLAGLVGSGRTEFAESLFGIRPIDRGEIFLNGRPISISSPQDALAMRIAYLPEDRRNHGVVLPMSVAQNTTLASLARVSTRGFLNFRAESQVAATFIGQLAIKTPSVATAVGQLSGGNQQKVALARWLMTDPEVLILDEPTQGIDIGAKAEIYDLIARLARKGVAILMISSDMNEVLGMSNRVAVMAKGRVAAVLERAEATPYAVLQYALGMPPQASPGPRA